MVYPAVVLNIIALDSEQMRALNKHALLCPDGQTLVFHLFCYLNQEVMLLMRLEQSESLNVCENKLLSAKQLTLVMSWDWIT